MSEAGGVVLGFDPGRRKTGVSLGNQITGTAQPLATVRGDLAAQCEAAEVLCRKWRPKILIIGLPDPEQAKAAHRFSRRFAEELESRCGAQVEFVDEDWSTQAARAERDGSPHSIDAQAAAILARDWLSRNSTDLR